MDRWRRPLRPARLTGVDAKGLAKLAGQARYRRLAMAPAARQTPSVLTKASLGAGNGYSPMTGLN